MKQEKEKGHKKKECSVFFVTPARYTNTGSIRQTLGAQRDPSLWFV